LLNVGAIPPEQMTDDEKDQAKARADAAAQQPDPAQQLVQVEGQKVANQQQRDAAKAQTDQFNAETKRLQLVQNSQTEQGKLALQAQGQASEQDMAVLEAFNLMANTLKTLREASMPS
jgi:hypothetical protein